MSDIKPTRLFLVRHGETEWNVARTFQGRSDSKLTPRGIDQAKELAERLSGEGLQAIYSSDQGRAMATARIVAERAGLKVIPCAGLREIDTGEWTGKSYQEVKARWPQEFATWRTEPHLHRMPGGETAEDVQRRGLAFLEYVRAHHAGETVCAVAHNTIVKTVMCYLKGWPLSRLWEGETQANCAVNQIELLDGKTELVSICETDHLTTVSTLGISIA